MAGKGKNERRSLMKACSLEKLDAGKIVLIRNFNCEFQDYEYENTHDLITQFILEENC